MDLSSLHNNLPRHKSPPPPLAPSTLTNDFKAAAQAVTKLYQNSARQIDQARQEGYLAAVQEVAALLSQGEVAGDHLREWCAVGLSRITAQQDEDNRTRPTQRRSEDAHEHDEPVRQTNTEPTPPVSPPETSSRMPLPNPFGNTEFTFQSPLPLPDSTMDISLGDHMEPEVTYELIETERPGYGRKRGVHHQLGSIWDIGANMGNKRSRHT